MFGDLIFIMEHTIEPVLHHSLNGSDWAQQFLSGLMSTIFSIVPLNRTHALIPCDSVCNRKLIFTAVYLIAVLTSDKLQSGAARQPLVANDERAPLVTSDMAAKWQFYIDAYFLFLLIKHKCHRVGEEKKRMAAILSCFRILFKLQIVPATA